VRSGIAWMSEARTVWHDLQTRRKAAAYRQGRDALLAAGLLIAMCAAEVLFLGFVAGPDLVDMLTAAQGAPVGGE
jgi:hypothetical protein